MSAEALHTFLVRAVNEPEFRGLLFRDPAQALAGYELSDDEATMLRTLKAENFDNMASDLEARVSRSMAAGTQDAMKRVLFGAAGNS